MGASCTDFHSTGQLSYELGRGLLSQTADPQLALAVHTPAEHTAIGCNHGARVVRARAYVRHPSEDGRGGRREHVGRILDPVAQLPIVAVPPAHNAASRQQGTRVQLPGDDLGHAGQDGEGWRRVQTVSVADAKLARPVLTPAVQVPIGGTRVAAATRHLPHIHDHWGGWRRHDACVVRIPIPQLAVVVLSPAVHSPIGGLDGTRVHAAAGDAAYVTQHRGWKYRGRMSHSGRCGVRRGHRFSGACRS